MYFYRIQVTSIVKLWLIVPYMQVLPRCMRHSPFGLNEADCVRGRKRENTLGLKVRLLFSFMRQRDRVSSMGTARTISFSKLGSSIRQILLLFAAVTMVLSWLIPNKYPPWVSFYNESCMAVALLLFALAQPLDRLRSGMPIVSWVFIAVAVIPWLQWIFGLLYYSGDAWVSSLYMLGCAVAVSTGYAWAKNDAMPFARLLSVATLVAAIISSGIALDQVLGGYQLGIWAADQPPGFRAIGNIAQPNNLATLIGFGAVGLLLLREQGLGTVSSFSILILLLLGSAATQSRTSLLFGPMIACTLFYFSKCRKISFQTKSTAVALIAAAYTLLLYCFYFLPTILWQVDANSLAERGLESGRFSVWPILIDSLNHKPWFGYGWLQVAAAQYQVANLHPPVTELFAAAHNVLLDLLIFCGYPLGLSLCALIIYWFVTRLRMISSLESACGMLLVSVLGIHSMLELPHYYSYFLIPAAMWIGLIEYSIGFRCWLSFRWRWFVYALTLFIFVAVCWDYPKVEADFRLARFEYLKIGKIYAASPAPDAPFLSNLTAFTRVIRVLPKIGMTDEELRENNAVTLRYPYVLLLYQNAVALALNGRTEDANRVFISIKHIYGDKAYISLKRAIKDRVSSQPKLDSFLATLPDS